VCKPCTWPYYSVGKGGSEFICAKIFGSLKITERSAKMGAIFQSLGRTVLAGFVVLAVIIIAASGAGAGAKLGDHAWWSFVFR